VYCETPNDYRIKYSSCYAKEYDRNTVVLLSDSFFYNSTEETGTYDEEADPEAIVCEYSFWNFNPEEGRTTSHSGSNLDDSIGLFDPLEFGAVNMALSTVLIESAPTTGAGKYRKLPHTANTTIFDPFVEERRFMNLYYGFKLNNPFVLSAWYNNRMFSAVEALELVLSGKRLGAAFTSDFYFGRSLKGTGVFLYYQRFKVARVSKSGQITLRVETSQLYDELIEHGLNVRIS